MSGRRGRGFVAQPLDGNLSIDLPTLIECNYIPEDRNITLTSIPLLNTFLRLTQRLRSFFSLGVMSYRLTRYETSATDLIAHHMPNAWILVGSSSVRSA